MSQQQQQSLEERAVGEFAPYKPLVPGFERHTEPVRCALWEVYASTLPLIVGVCARNALVCLAPSFYNSPKLGFTGRLLVDHVVITTCFCLGVITYPSASYGPPVAVSVALAVASSGAAFVALLLRRRRWMSSAPPSSPPPRWLPAELGGPTFAWPRSGGGSSPRATFVTDFRGLIYLPTCVCILAR